MIQKDCRTYLLLAVLLFAGVLLAGNAAGAEDSCVSTKCHAKLLQGSTVHPVAEACDGCHQSVATPHPQKGKQTFKLTQEPPDLCYMCHEQFGTKKVVHPPAESGMCTGCHDPHSSNQPKLLLQPMKELCGTCHPDHLDFKYLHGPVSAGDCTACHAPHESDNKALLLKEGADLCVTCHVDMQDVLKEKNVHPALAGGCTGCHNPHGSDYPKMLPDELPQMCFLCHPQIGDKVNDSSTVHAAIYTENSCATCHSPHASNNEKLLLKPVKEMCTTCHDNVIPKDATVLHGPNNDGKCTRCHDPHGSNFDTLLVGEFPEDIYVPYTDKQYGLCFTCHNRDMVTYPETSFATNFRDGEKNLHYVHVHREKGRSCVLCHSFHGSPNPKLIAVTVPFGKWQLPLKFVKTDTGGGCSPGCHKPRYYDRKSPGRKPEVHKAPRKAG